MKTLTIPSQNELEIKYMKDRQQAAAAINSALSILQKKNILSSPSPAPAKVGEK